MTRTKHLRHSLERMFSPTDICRWRLRTIIAWAWWNWSTDLFQARWGSSRGWLSKLWYGTHSPAELHGKSYRAVVVHSSFHDKQRQKKSIAFLVNYTLSKHRFALWRFANGDIHPPTNRHPPTPDTRYPGTSGRKGKKSRRLFRSAVKRANQERKGDGWQESAPNLQGTI